jgi:hypothetical protein
MSHETKLRRAGITGTRSTGAHGFPLDQDPESLTSGAIDALHKLAWSDEVTHEQAVKISTFVSQLRGNVRANRDLRRRDPDDDTRSFT